WSFFVFFFFQAEDGIRDFHVTGVQTCALPIYPASMRRRWKASAMAASSSLPGRGQSARPRASAQAASSAAFWAAARVSKSWSEKIGRASCRERGWSEEAGGALEEGRRTDRDLW